MQVISSRFKQNIFFSTHNFILINQNKAIRKTISPHHRPYLNTPIGEAIARPKSTHKAHKSRLANSRNMLELNVKDIGNRKLCRLVKGLNGSPLQFDTHFGQRRVRDDILWRALTNAGSGVVGSPDQT